MYRTPIQRAIGLAGLATVLVALLVGHEIWTVPITRSAPAVTFVDDLLVDTLGIGQSEARPEADWTQWYLFAISAVGAALVVVRVLLHWRCDLQELALVPATRSSSDDATRDPTPNTETLAFGTADPNHQPEDAAESTRPDSEAGTNAEVSRDA